MSDDKDDKTHRVINLMDALKASIKNDDLKGEAKTKLHANVVPLPKNKKSEKAMQREHDKFFDKVWDAIGDAMNADLDYDRIIHTLVYLAGVQIGLTSVTNAEACGEASRRGEVLHSVAHETWHEDGQDNICFMFDVEPDTALAKCLIAINADGPIAQSALAASVYGSDTKETRAATDLLLDEINDHIRASNLPFAVAMFGRGADPDIDLMSVNTDA
jgi:hypothetical protein